MPTITNVPENWTTTEEEMMRDVYWSDASKEGLAAVSARGLSAPTVLMRRTLSSGGDMFLFESGSKYYFWVIPTSEVCEIKQPAGLDAILVELAKRPRHQKIEVEIILEKSRGNTP
ncbi:hypothetical protein F5Y18DRAFT_421696 [Xylariaceae sp. FL1019]|nr:hypothetical protein F5Y18DRAFT_421696 [Xylariaceae sp. FL1019]